MKITTLLSFIFILILAPWHVLGQNNRKVAVLDMTNYNSETSSSRSLSAIRIMRTIGVPFEQTTNLSDAIQYPVIITGSRIEDASFTSAQRAQLINYVYNGGVLITSCLRDPDLFNLCGITSRNTSNTLYEITFDTEAAPIFDMVDDPMERTVSIGDPSKGFSFYTQYYELGTGTSLANYGNNSIAMVKNNFGEGTVYLFGPDFRDITYRNQLNFDVSAQRTYSNGFEPTTDVFFFIVRNIVREHIPHTVFKYTIPYKYTSALMITHDVDSQTAVDTMHFFSDYEQNAGISALYNITTRYFNDSWMSNFYVGAWPEIQALIDEGHVVASHAVGHFPDFDDESTFPLGALGNNANNYSPYYSSGSTVGGTVLGELEVSKQLLENDHGVEIKSFRPGHLAYNDSLALGMQMTGYEFSSSVSANSVLTSFPYYTMKVRSFDGIESSVLEIPMTISDVFDDINETNYSEKVDIWLDATFRYDANHSPVVLLIHPNRTWKLLAEIEYLNQIPPDMLIYPFEKYGIFWRKRDSLKFQTEINNNNMLVTLQNDLLAQAQSFVLDFDGLNGIQFLDRFGEPVEFEWIPWDNGTRLYYQQETGMGTNFAEKNFAKNLIIYPNPSRGKIRIIFPRYQNNARLNIYDLYGRKIYSKPATGNQETIWLTDLNIEMGMYIVVGEFQNKTQRGKFVYQK